MSKDGGPAFPRAGFDIDMGSQSDAYTEPQHGMTLRDYAAIHLNFDEDDYPSTVGACAKVLGITEGEYKKLGTGAWMSVEAKMRYQKADAMLKAREE